MTNVAYQERDLRYIQRMEKIDFCYRTIRKVLGFFFRTQNKQVKTISTYPKIQNERDLVEIANKLAWAFPKKNNLVISILIDDKLTGFDLGSVSEIPNQRSYLGGDLSHINLSTFLVKSDLVLFIKAKSILHKLRFLRKSEILDKWYFSTVEGGLLQCGYSKTLSSEEVKVVEEISVRNYQYMIDDNRSKRKSYCFVTGPSFDKYKDFSYETDSFKIICNSVVKNNDFLEYIGKPDLLVFADPVFHFSPSEYSATFRDEVCKVYDKYKPYVMVPFNTVALLLSYYPEMEDRIIGIKVNDERINFPSIDEFWVKGSANILTLFMLPVASAITDEINVIGADGRDPDEKYFWTHSKSAQFGDLMNTVFETHPSFFRDRDYKDYYVDHCAFMKELIEFGEAKKKKYFSLTKSYIPVLLERYRGDSSLR